MQIKTRKRNIAVALDPGSFADAVVTIFEDAKDGDDLEKNLSAGVKVVEGTQLDFSRYGDTLFEVFFAGGRLAAGGNVVEEGKKLDTNVSTPIYPTCRAPPLHRCVLQCVPCYIFMFSKSTACCGAITCVARFSRPVLKSRTHALCSHATGSGSGGDERCDCALHEDVPDSAQVLPHGNIKLFCMHSSLQAQGMRVVRTHALS